MTKKQGAVNIEIEWTRPSGATIIYKKIKEVKASENLAPLTDAIIRRALTSLNGTAEVTIRITRLSEQPLLLSELVNEIRPDRDI